MKSPLYVIMYLISVCINMYKNYCVLIHVVVLLLALLEFLVVAVAIFFVGCSATLSHMETLCRI